jgi:hypothetical protein
LKTNSEGHEAHGMQQVNAEGGGRGGGRREFSTNPTPFLGCWREDEGILSIITFLICFIILVLFHFVTWLHLARAWRDFEIFLKKN